MRDVDRVVIQDKVIRDSVVMCRQATLHNYVYCKVFAGSTVLFARTTVFRA